MKKGLTTLESNRVFALRIKDDYKDHEVGWYHELFVPMSWSFFIRKKDYLWQ